MTRPTRYAMGLAAALLAAVLVVGVVLAALNPEVEPTECKSERIDVCGGAEMPSANTAGTGSGAQCCAPAPASRTSAGTAAPSAC